MKIKNIEMKEINLPFNIRFKHSSAEHMSSDSVLVIVESDNHKYGYGEGCPRTYVTGETKQSTIEFFDTHKKSIGEIINLKQLKNWIKDKESLIDLNPSSWCAIELALLDLLGKELYQTVEELLDIPNIEGKFNYTAVLGVDNFAILKSQFDKYVEMGFKDFKIKISGELEQDRLVLDLFRGINDLGVRLRVDANNLWVSAKNALSYLNSLNYKFFAVEEPLSVNRYDELRYLSNELGTKIILDESFLKREQFELISGDPEKWIINLRISKLGGLLRSLAIADAARSNNINIIIGANIGETSILTRAALTIANAYRDILIFQEGAFGTYLLKEDICEPSIVFKKGGTLLSSQISINNKDGFGLNVIMN